VTEQYQQPNINLLPDPETFQGFLGINTPIPAATLTPLPWTVETITSPLISHLAGSSDLTFLANGRVVIQWTASIGNTINARTQSATVLFVNSGAGFALILGTIGFGYHRNIAEGAGTTTGQNQFSVSQNDVIRIVSIRTSGVGSLQFLALSCEILVHFFPDI
jgi:hypothetical protein